MQRFWWIFCDRGTKNPAGEPRGGLPAGRVYAVCGVFWEGADGTDNYVTCVAYVMYVVYMTYTSYTDWASRGRGGPGGGWTAGGGPRPYLPLISARLAAISASVTS